MPPSCELPVLVLKPHGTSFHLFLEHVVLESQEGFRFKLKFLLHKCHLGLRQFFHMVWSIRMFSQRQKAETRPPTGLSLDKNFDLFLVLVKTFARLFKLWLQHFSMKQ